MALWKTKHNPGHVQKNRGKRIPQNDKEVHLHLYCCHQRILGGNVCLQPEFVRENVLSSVRKAGNNGGGGSGTKARGDARFFTLHRHGEKSIERLTLDYEKKRKRILRLLRVVFLWGGKTNRKRSCFFGRVIRCCTADNQLQCEVVGELSN